MHAPAPPRPIAYAAPRIVCEQAADGSLRCRSTEPLASHDPSLARLFRAAVEHKPGGLFLAERGPDGAWRKLTYEAARRSVDALAQGLIERGLSAERPVMILSGNGIEHALLTLAGHTAGVPVARTKSSARSSVVPTPPWMSRNVMKDSRAAPGIEPRSARLHSHEGAWPRDRWPSLSRPVASRARVRRTRRA